MTKRIIVAAGTLLCVLVLTGCGQKGPLYIPPEPETTDVPEERPTPDEEVSDNV